jgi:hypothetical protein
MSKQVMALNVLAEFIANTFNSSQVLVEKNNFGLTIEPVSATNADSSSNNIGQLTSSQEINVDETKAGTLTLDDFTEIKLFTKGYKFNRDDAYERN